MNIKQQLEQVIAYAHKEAEVACVHHRYYAHLDEIASRLSAIVEQMEKVEPVAWVNPVALEQVQEFDCVQILFYRRGHNHSPGDMGRIPLYAAPQVPDGVVQLDAARSTAAIAWGWLWHVTTADDRVKTARQLLGQMLDKDLKRYGIQTAKDEAAGGASDVERVVRPCNSCGSKRYEIQHLYTGYRENLLLVQCGDCKDRIIPVVVDYFMPQQDVYAECEKAWNVANAGPNSE